MNDLYIEWDTRNFFLITRDHMDQFFPCSFGRFKKLLKTVELDWHRDELKEKLKSYFQNKIPKLPEEAEALKKEAAEHRKEAAKYKAEIAAEKKRAKAAGEMPDLMILKDHCEYEKQLAAEKEREAKNRLNSKAKFERYIEML